MQTLFGYPCFKANIQNTRYDRSKIIKDITANYKLDPYRDSFPHSNNHQFHKDKYNKKFKQIDFSSLVPIYHNVIELFFKNIPLTKEVEHSFSIENYVVTKKGQYMSHHVHPRCHFSGIHYLKFNPEFHPSTIFVNPNQVLPTYYSDYNPTFRQAAVCDTHTSFMHNSFRFFTEEEDMLIFPNTLEHWVPAQTKKSNDLRITIVFNIYIKQKIEDAK
jgi:hypothetical protein